MIRIGAIEADVGADASGKAIGVGQRDPDEARGGGAVGDLRQREHGGGSEFFVAFEIERDPHGALRREARSGVGGDGGFEFERVGGDEAEDGRKGLNGFAGAGQERFDEAADWGAEGVLFEVDGGGLEFEFGLFSLELFDEDGGAGVVDFELGSGDFSLVCSVLGADIPHG